MAEPCEQVSADVKFGPSEFTESTAARVKLTDGSEWIGVFVPNENGDGGGFAAADEEGFKARCEVLYGDADSMAKDDEQRQAATLGQAGLRRRLAQGEAVGDGS